MNFKKLLAILLAVLLLGVCFVGCSKDKKEEDDEQGNDKTADEIYTIDNFDYSVNGEGTYEIVGLKYSGTKPVKVIIPHIIEGRLVTGIADDAFKAVKTIKEVEIPNTIEYIGVSAFYDCDLLETVTIGGKALTDKYAGAVIADGDKTTGTTADKDAKYITEADTEVLVRIGENAFRNCDALKKINLPSTLKTISAYAFYECKALNDITFPSALEVIEAGAFYDCASLTAVVLPETMTDIGDTAFYGCTSLKSASVPSVKLGALETNGDEKIEHVIGEYVFNNCHEDLVIKVTEDSVFAEYAESLNYNVEYVK